MSGLKAKMHQNRFSLGLCPDPARGLTALPNPLYPIAGFKGPTSKWRSKERGGRERIEGKGRKREERRRQGREEEKSK